MRNVVELQIMLDDIKIEDVKIDPKCRDDIPQILRGLQYIYTQKEIREKVFAVLEKLVPPNIDKNNGRPGMKLWRIFVLGVLRLDLNWDYDRLQDIANNHHTIREMLLHGIFDQYQYNLQTIKDNVKLFTPEILDEINQIVVEVGHGVVKKKDSGLKTRCDTFVVKTDIHYPTDINLLFDAMRKSIELTARLCEKNNIGGWRQYHHNIGQLKRALRYAQSSKKATYKTEEQKQIRDKKIMNLHQQYIELSKHYFDRIKETIKYFESNIPLSFVDCVRLSDIENFLKHAERQIAQIHRRVMCSETIPHAEKIFSIFEPHTEWICKGKMGVPVELGLKVCVIEDQYQFILHHKVMRKQTDDKVAVPMVEETKLRFKDIISVSFDRGFFSTNNRNQLQKMLKMVALPKKGRLSEQDKVIETGNEFLQAKYKHAAIESAINALDVHGLDRCLDHGTKGFNRYVALAIIARNVQRIGAILLKKELRLLTLREQRFKKAA